jgi:DNA polymerase III subunit alpha
MSRQYVNLHGHSTLSTGDGYAMPEEHVRRVAELGQPAMALTEHGNVSSHVKLEQAALEHGIKPIFGVELYCDTGDERGQLKHHLTTLAMNQQGYRNLLGLVTETWDNFKYKPTATGDMLAKYSEGLIVLSGCLGGRLATAMLGGKGEPEKERADLRAGRAVVDRFRHVFGDRYYLEVQAHPSLPRQVRYNQALWRLSEQTGIPLVVTGDTHYPRLEDQELYPLLHAIDRGGRNNTVEAQAASWEYDIELTHHSAEDMARLLRQAGLGGRAADGAVAQSLEIADRCTVTLPKLKDLTFPTNRGSAEELWDWVKEGWHYRGMDQLPRAERAANWDRVRYEMKLVLSKGFTDYFLVISDMVRWAKENGIPVGPARGSAAASLVCYLIRITEVNPMLFPNLLFERFIDPNRHDLPDIDLDFDDDQRWRIRDYLVRKYGSERVGNIGTFVMYKGKNSLDDVARVNRVPKYAVEQIKDKLIERASGDLRGNATIEDTIEMFPDVAKVFRDWPVLAQAQRLEGNVKGFSVHAAGLVVAQEPLTDSVAVYTRTDSKTGKRASVCSIDKYDAEYIGALKIDALGLTTMGMIKRCLDMVGMTLEELYAIPLDDESVFEGFRRNEVVGVFQFDGRAMRSVNREVKPDTFAEICDINALARPGPLHSGAAAEYIMVKHGKKKAEKLHEVVERICAHTNQQIVYQEQILQVVRELGGFTWEQAASIRKLISKKQGEQAFNRMRDLFMEGCARRGDIQEIRAAKVWKQLVTAGAYAFCPTGDTVVYTAGSNENGRKEWTLKELYDTINGPRSPIRDKLRYGQYGRKALLHQLDDDGRIRPRDFVGLKRSDIKVPVLRFTTESGRTIKVSHEHRFMTDQGYCKADELAVGDWLVVCDPYAKYKQAPTPYEGRERGMHARSVAAVRERAGGSCEHCHKSEHGRMEAAHVLPLDTFGGDWARYHHPRNMLWLCNSCHKKFDYAKGERKYPHAVGKPAWPEQIVAITDEPWEYVYDLEMAAPNHNYVTNGIVSHNNAAHCVSYGMLAYWTMWLKQHHPLEFYCAALQKYDPKTKGLDLLKEAVGKGIRILPPSAGRSGLTWQPLRSKKNGPGLLAGFTQVPGVGDKMAPLMLARREACEERGGRVRDWSDYLEVRGFGPGTCAKLEDFCTTPDPFGVHRLRKRLSAARRWLWENGDRHDLPQPSSRSEDVPYEAKRGEHIWVGQVVQRNLKDIYELHRSRTGEELNPETVKEPEYVNYVVITGEDETGPLVITVHRWGGFYEKYKDVVWGINPATDLLLVRGYKRSEYRRALYAVELHVLSIQEGEDG